MYRLSYTHTLLVDILYKPSTHLVVMYQLTYTHTLFDGIFYKLDTHLVIMYQLTYTHTSSSLVCFTNHEHTPCHNVT